MQNSEQGAVVSVMLAVADVPEAVAWYEHALGAVLLWSLGGGVAGLQIAGGAFFLGTPSGNGWEIPARLGMGSARIEVFCDDPDAFVARALAAGAVGTAPEDHGRPWGNHRQGGFTDPFGHIWLVGDRSPLLPWPR
jgi:uncharacterized glyoxalase superfamily protein PhnB